MRTVPLFAAVLILMHLSFAQTQPSKPLTPSKAVSPFEQELLTNQTEFMQAVEQKDVARVRQSVAEDFRGIGNNGDYYEREELVDSAHNGSPKGQRMYDMVVVRVGDECAVVSYNLVVPGSRIRYRHMSDTWAKISGSWKLKFQQMTINLFSATDFD
jgi:hypothetical protein